MSSQGEKTGTPKKDESATVAVEQYTPPKGITNPLSELPRDRSIPVEMILTPGPADRCPLEKSSPTTPGEPIQKDPTLVMTDTLALIRYGVVNSTQQRMISDELRALLTHEKKLLEQLLQRASKFQKMKEENIKVIEEWEKDHNARMPFYEKYLKELMAIPEGQVISQEGMPQAVQQKILYKIVENTSDVANNALVQMQLQKTLTEDVDLTLSKLKQFCLYLMTHVEEWLNTVTTQACDVRRIHLQWMSLNKEAKKLQEPRKIGGEQGTPCSVDDLANTLTRLCGNMEDIRKTMRILEERQTRIETYNLSGVETLSASGLPSPSPSQMFQPDQSSNLCSALLNLYQTPPPEGPGAPGPYPVGEAYFGIPMSPPPPRPPGLRPPPSATPLAPSYGPDGRLQRKRAPPGQFPGLEILDVPGMGFPIPRAAMEKGGRVPGTPLPKTPPPPEPPHFGRFQPVAVSSPTGSVRPPQDFFTPMKQGRPQLEEPLDPRLLPKIQQDLKSLSQRNRKLQDLVANFRQTRGLLMEEMDKAVRLNQKLQRDLYLVAQEATRQPQ